MPERHRDRVLRLITELGLLRAKEVAEAGVPYGTLTRMVDRGEIVRVARGLYELPDADVSGQHTLAEAARRIPGGVVCLLSALAFHEVTTQLPFDVWLAYERGKHRPKVDAPAVRLFRVSPVPFWFGIERHAVDGVDVKIYSLPKTVADCFKFRSTVGLDVAIEALRGYLGNRMGTVDELWEAAGVCRVQNVLRPYLEALV